tara:strand:- start:12 stop:719 length:708 start_codon:yes stop_codon:yes gene_type:complete
VTLRNYLFKTKLTYKIYLYYNLYVRHKCYLNRTQYSQWGEDKIIFEFFANKKNGTYLDVGCFHPIMYSNTCLLFKHGWKGINIDINQTSIDLFNIIRPNDINLCTTIDESKFDVKAYIDHPLSPVNTVIEEYYKSYKKKFFNETTIISVKSKTINEVLDLANLKNIDFLNVDVEGMDLKILKQLIPIPIKPRLVSIETHNVDGSESKDCQQIIFYLKNYSYKVLKRSGPTTLFHF